MSSINWACWVRTTWQIWGFRPLVLLNFNWLSAACTLRAKHWTRAMKTSTLSSYSCLIATMAFLSLYEVADANAYCALKTVFILSNDAFCWLVSVLNHYFAPPSTAVESNRRSPCRWASWIWTSQSRFAENPLEFQSSIHERLPE